jgi:hypothetical protein
MLTRLGRLVTVLPAYLVLCSSCELFEASGCDAYATWMLAVNVTDSQTGNPIAVPFTVAVYSSATGDSVVYVLPADTPKPFQVPEGARPGWAGGRYSVEVRAAGFQTWRSAEIVIKEKDCGHPITQSVQATLLPL